MVCHLHPISCITPPHMLREIIERGTPVQRRHAERTLEVTEDFRAKRLILHKGEMEGHPVTGPALQRRVFSAENGSMLPGKLVRSEGQPPSADPAVNEAFDGAGATYHLFWEIYERNSIDNLGAGLDSTVHYLKGYDNAFWNGRQMVYGDGDEDLPISERLFNRFTSAMDVIGHEITHAVTQYEANLRYADQPGALNESISDVFGALVKQHCLRQTVMQADWVIGSGLFTENVNGVGIRSMKAPGTAYDDPVLGKDPQPAHMKDYRHVPYDNGGVHINSGIPNHAFYLTAMEMGGYAWEKAGRIWYVVLRDKLQAISGFQAAAQMTYETAGDLYGKGSLEQQAVRKGWEGVGIYLPSDPVPASPGCLPALVGLMLPKGMFRR